MTSAASTLARADAAAAEAGAQPPRTVVCLSGGLDSTVLAAHLLDAGHHLTGVSFNYGQRHRGRELDAAAAVAEHLGFTHLVLDLTGVTVAMDPASSSLLAASGRTVPEGHYSDDSMASTVVPGRNLLMIAAAAAVAATHDASTVAIAAHAGDHPIYPDCRPEFIAAADEALQVGSGVRLLAPFATRTKAGIVTIGTRLGAPLHLTWSCYTGGQVHCGRCGTCVERYEAFRDAAVADPTRYADTTLAQTVTA